MTEFDLKAAQDALSGPQGSLPQETEKAALRSSVANVAALSLEERMRKDFRYFLREVWRALGLPDPTPIQYNFAWWLQHGPDRSVQLAFRGMGKTFITAAFGVWNLWKDPDYKVLVVSGAGRHAVSITNFALSLIRTIPFLKHMEPDGWMRQSSTGFDVKGARPDPTPSFSAIGITAQLVGKRANLIIPDDIETNTNSATDAMRQKLREQVREFDAILKPGGKIKYLGTPQSQNSIYFELPPEVYTIRIWPARYPGEELQKRYGKRLAPMIRKTLESGDVKIGDSTEPLRFDNEELFKREVSWGKSGFALQYMLDPSLADVGLYPLKLADLIVMGIDPARGPTSVSWGNDERLRHKDIPMLGLDGDGYYRPASISDTSDPFPGPVMAIDPSGRGKDELGYSIGDTLHGRIFVFAIGGHLHGYSEATMHALFKQIVRFGVRRVVIEDNFGDGIYTSLFKVNLDKFLETHNKNLPADKKLVVGVEGVKSSRTQKELRIIATLEPALDAHRIVVDKGAIEADVQTASAYQVERPREYSAFYQLTHLTRDKDCLAHDDRLEALAMLVEQLSRNLSIDTEDSAKEAREEEFRKALKALGLEEEEIRGERGLDREATMRHRR